MRAVKRARYTDPTSGLRSRIGGLPSHLPPEWPTVEATGEKLAFIAQFYTQELAPVLREEGLCLQLYQSLAPFYGEDTPRVVIVPQGAPLNLRCQGLCSPEIRVHDIEWEDDVEPDWIDLSHPDPEVVGHWFATEFGGAALDEASFHSGKHVGFVADRGEGFSFGVTSLVVRRRDCEYELATW